MTNMPTVVFDLEGVLIDNSSRLEHALKAVGARDITDIREHKREQFWRVFLDLRLAKSLDKVNDLGLMILSDRSQKYKISIVSGTIRPIGIFQINLIKSRAKELNLKVRIDSIFLRAEGNYIKATSFKELILRKLLMSDTIVELHDDDEEIIEMAKKYGIRTVLWRNLRPVESILSPSLF